MSAWWQGTRLVAERGLVENVRSRSFRIVTGLLLLISIAAVIVPRRLGGGPTTYTLATVGEAPATVVTTLDAAGTSGHFTVKYVSRDDEDAVRLAVRDGDATAGLAGQNLYTSSQAGLTFPALVAQTVMTLEMSSRLADAGSAIATTVGMEKSTWISEVLLAVLRPSQVLVGTVLAVGAATLLQMLVLATPLVVSLRTPHGIGLPPIAGGDIALAVVWFVVGFLLYAFLFAATAALVNKVTEVGSAILPVTMTLLAGYLPALTVVAGDPNGGWGVAASLFPLTAPLAMPIRWAAGEVPLYQLLLAMALTAGTAVLLVSLASSIYRRALLITGHRVKLREVIGRRADA